jgi:uncharacterized RDD family membrane protein YckC
MQLRDEQNPYAPPAATEQPPYQGAVDDEPQIAADRWTRWGARLIDGLLSAVLVVPVVIYQFQFGGLTLDRLSRDGVASLYFFVPMLPVLIYQWYLVSRSGQTLGKRWLHIRVVKVDGSPVNFVSGVLLREWVTSSLGFIPVVGRLIDFVGTLMIFGQEQRCLHDHIAGTKVIAVLKSV